LKIKALIFDVDGTLADTEEAHRESFNCAFREHRLDWHWSRGDYARWLDVAGGKERLAAFIDTLPLADAPPLAERVRLDLISQKPRRLRRLTAAGVAVHRPGLLQHNDIGVECGDGREIVVGPGPSVHPAVHVVVGDAQHGPTRR